MAVRPRLSIDPTIGIGALDCPASGRRTADTAELAGSDRLVAVLAPNVRRTMDAYLSDADRLLPDRVVGLYVVGSTALGEYRQARSDIDFVAVVDGHLDRAEIRQLRRLHLRTGVRGARRAIGDRRSLMSGGCNGVFVRASDLVRPVSEIDAIASHIGTSFHVGHGGTDLSPVGWHVLAHHGLAVRGPSPNALGLDPQPELMVAWNLHNLESYWRPWAHRVLHSPASRFALRPSFWTAWGMLGPPRLHSSIRFGDVISKEDAGAYALATFGETWHPLLLDAIAYRNGTERSLRMSPRQRGEQTARFVLEVIGTADDLNPAASSPRPDA